jgi:hypothetical protein
VRARENFTPVLFFISLKVRKKMALNKSEVEDYLGIVESVEITESFSVNDLRLQQFYEKKMNVKQADIVGDFNETANDAETDSQMRGAFRRMARRLRATV